MSLNGLDNAPVQEAYQAALAEPGGWFLMKYCSRDAVELLAQGNTGVNGARNAIAKYEEASPLYGLLIYRRRKVLIKFIPEGTSRLLQARTAVHFQDVLERYSPYETLLEITDSEALNDTSLASAFPLHTASPAISSNRLHEISEDAEDGGSAPIERPLNPSASTGNVFGTQRYKMERRVEQIMQPDRQPPSIRVTGDTPSSPTPGATIRPAVPHSMLREDLARISTRSLDSPRSTASRIEPDAPSLNGVPTEHASNAAPPTIPDKSAARSPVSEADSPRTETAVERPPRTDSLGLRERAATSASDKVKIVDDPYDFSKFEYKPKVKLGPRPVASSEMSKRPTTASIAGVPSQFRPIPRKQEQDRPKSQGLAGVLAAASAAQPPLAAPPPPIPSAPEYNPRPVSRGSIKSLPTHKASAMTPDKIRLMKAVELRKRQLRKSNPQDSFQPPADQAAPEVPPIPDVPVRSPQRLENVADLPVLNGQNSAHNSDSGIEMQYDKVGESEDQKPLQDSMLPATTAEPVPSKIETPSETTIVPVNEPLPEPESPHQTASEDVEQGLLPRQRSRLEIKAEPLPTDPDSEYESFEDTVETPSQLTPVPTILTDHSSPPQASLPKTNEPLPSNGTSEEDDAEATQNNEQKSEDEAGATGDRRQKSEDEEEVEQSEALEQTSEDDEQKTEKLDGDKTPIIAPSDDNLRPISPARQNSDLAKRRRGFVEPLQLDASPSGNPDDFISDDDDFLEELRSAPVEQAKPIQVAKSPANVDFHGRRPSTASGVSDAGASVKSIRIKKSATALDRPETYSRLSPEPSQVPHYVPTGMQDSTNATGIARNVSSGISKRIQALAELSSRESLSSRENTPSRPLTPETSPNAFLQRDQRERTAMVRNAHKTRPTSFRRQSSKSSGSPQIGQAGNVPIVSVQRDAAGNRNSVSVTARIVRPSAARETSNNSAKFQQSELKISTPPANAQTQPVTAQMAESVRSLNSHGALSPPLSPVSTGSRPTNRFTRMHASASPSPDDFPPPPTQRPNTGTTASVDESTSTKEGSRTSRFFKRMSNLGGGGKRKSGPQRTSAASSVPSTDNAPSKAVESKAAPPPPPPEKPDTPPAIVVGDLNVQFPDSLLWKRRIVTIDETGNLQFAIAQAMDIHKSVAVKKFHLADFKLPYAPDLDYQELPHSVVLEFGDGTSLQVACEDSMTHRQVLHLLKTHWKAWAQAS